MWGDNRKNKNGVRGQKEEKKKIKRSLAKWKDEEIVSEIKR